MPSAADIASSVFVEAEIARRERRANAIRCLPGIVWRDQDEHEKQRVHDRDAAEHPADGAGCHDRAPPRPSSCPGTGLARSPS
jgi:hypothetical protein